MARINYENPRLEGSLETEMFISRLNEDPRINSITFGDAKVDVEIGEIGKNQRLAVFNVRGRSIQDPEVKSFLEAYGRAQINYNIKVLGENSGVIGVNLSLDELPPIKFRTRFLEPDGGIKQRETTRPGSRGPQLSVDTTVSVGKMKDDMRVIVQGGSVIFKKRIK